MKKQILIFILLFSIGFVFAQRGNNVAQRNKFDVALFKQKQAEHIIKELGLTDKEAKAFIPLVNEFTEKKFELNRTVRLESRSLRNKPNATQAEYNKALDNYLNARTKEVQLEKEYYDKFRSILPIDKVYRFERVERRFNEEAIATYRQRVTGEKSALSYENKPRK